MLEFIVVWLVRLAAVYLAAGVLAAIPFVLKGVGRIDPSALGASRGFRLIIFPGVVALWPLLVIRLLRGQTQPPAPQDAHRLAAKSEAA